MEGSSRTREEGSQSRRRPADSVTHAAEPAGPAFDPTAALDAPTVLALQSTAGNAAVSRLVELRRNPNARGNQPAPPPSDPTIQRDYKIPDVDHATMGLSFRQQSEVSGWLPFVAQARGEMDRQNFLGAHGRLNALDNRGRAFKEANQARLTARAALPLGEADLALNEALIQVHALGASRRESIKNLFQTLVKAQGGILGVVEGNDKLTPAEKDLLRAQEGALGRERSAIEKMEASQETLRGMLDRIVFLPETLRNLTSRAPELGGPAQTIRAAVLILQALVNPREAVISARQLINECEAAIRRTLALPTRYDPDDPYHAAPTFLPPGAENFKPPQTTLQPD